MHPLRAYAGWDFLKDLFTSLTCVSTLDSGRLLFYALMSIGDKQCHAERLHNAQYMQYCVLYLILVSMLAALMLWRISWPCVELE